MNSNVIKMKLKCIELLASHHIVLNEVMLQLHPTAVLLKWCYTPLQLYLMMLYPAAVPLHLAASAPAY